MATATLLIALLADVVPLVTHLGLSQVAIQLNEIEHTRELSACLTSGHEHESRPYQTQRWKRWDRLIVFVSKKHREIISLTAHRLT